MNKIFRLILWNIFIYFFIGLNQIILLYYANILGLMEIEVFFITTILYSIQFLTIIFVLCK